jgi:hypothetical protein
MAIGIEGCDRTGATTDAGEAHADSAHAATAAFAVHLLGQCAQPVDDRARLAAAPDPELARDAHILEHLTQRIAGRDRPTRLAEQARQKYGHSRRRDAIGETDHERMQAGNLVNDDHGRP